MNRGRQRIFVGLTEVAGYYRGLMEGFDALGVDATFVDLSANPYEYGGADKVLLAELLKFGRRHGLTARGLDRIPAALLFPWAAARFDVFIFAFRRSFLPGHADLPILRQLGKKIIFTFHGSDSRPPYLDGSLMAPDRGRSIAKGIALARAQKASIRTIDRYADVVVNTPPQGHFHEKPFVLWMRVGVPSRPAVVPERVSTPPLPPDRPLRILHSPSHPQAKGSDEIRRAVARQVASGRRLELIEITGQPNRVVLDELSRADFVIDQLWSDTPMPGFAAEAAWYGKPVIIGGYAKPLWDELLPPEWIPPTHYCHPNELDQAITRLATDHEYRHTLGARARAFVETKWHPKAVAARYLDLVSRPIPADWMYDPRNNRYWQGGGLPEDRTAALIRSFIAEGGRDALQLSDKPELLEVMEAQALGRDRGTVDRSRVATSSASPF